MFLLVPYVSICLIYILSLVTGLVPVLCIFHASWNIVQYIQLTCRIFYFGLLMEMLNHLEFFSVTVRPHWNGHIWCCLGFCYHVHLPGLKTIYRLISYLVHYIPPSRESLKEWHSALHGYFLLSVSVKFCEIFWSIKSKHSLIRLLLNVNSYKNCLLTLQSYLYLAKLIAWIFFLLFFLTFFIFKIYLF